MKPAGRHRRVNAASLDPAAHSILERPDAEAPVSDRQACVPTATLAPMDRAGVQCPGSRP
jgi:hypothetical protein